MDGLPGFIASDSDFGLNSASSIDEFVRLMKDGNNGGYANNWLVADRKTNEIASLELGLKNVTLERTTDGCFVGANFPVNPRLVREETKFDVSDLSLSANARRLRWDALMADHSPRGFAHWLPPYAAGGAAQNKVVDSTTAERMSFWALAGHACGLDFKAAEHLAAHPEFNWQKDFLRDIPSRPWTLVGIE